MTIMVGGTASQGTPIGILMADTVSPHIIGDVGNGFTYDFPVRFCTVKGASASRIAERDSSLLTPCLEAAHHLASEGCQAITCGCSAFSIFQQQLSSAVEIPVFCSSLIQASFAAQIIQPTKKVGILTENSSWLQRNDCAGYGLSAERIVISGMDADCVFYRTFYGDQPFFEYEAVQADVLQTAKNLMANSPDVGVIICEGTFFTPFSPEINRATGVPVFDMVTLIHLVASGILRGLTSPFKNRLTGGVTSVPPQWGKKPNHTV